MRKNFVEELKWRGMLAQMMPGTEELLQKEMVTAYLGTDPTADSLHIGHLCGIMMLRHLQRCGHRPVILVGGATGMIGDPSGKSQERNLLNDETLRHNQEYIKAQVAKFLDFESKDENAALMVNNYDWMKDFTFLDFAREVGKHITVNYMMAKESVQQRLNGTARDGLSFTEFTYQLLQGYDFLYLYQHYGVKLQLGGNDQWGNMTTGTELIRRTLGNEVETFALTCPLITKSDGKKFGKTETHHALSLLSVLAQRQRRRCRTLHQDFHFARKGRDRCPYRRAQTGPWPPRTAEASGSGGHHIGTLAGGTRHGD